MSHRLQSCLLGIADSYLESAKCRVFMRVRAAPTCLPTICAAYLAVIVQESHLGPDLAVALKALDWL